MNKLMKWSVVLSLSAIGGPLIAKVLLPLIPQLKQMLYLKPYVYASDNTQTIAKLADTTLLPLSWSQLIPDAEKSIIQKYQVTAPTNVTEFSDQLLLSIQASTDQAYISAMQSSNTVEAYNEQAVLISGFIVPIDFDELQNPTNIFIVPYFGACIHFPPPPNQMIYARLSSNFKDFDITQAYKLTGVIRQQMFDDHLGTSAYALEVAFIEPYYSEPDDFRQH
jgi:hypothetical protein